MNEKLRKIIEEQFIPKASILIINPQALLSRMEDVRKKVTKDSVKSAFGDSYRKLRLFLDMTLAYAKGDYRNINKNSMVKIIGALLYFLMPFDFVPDFILGLGLVDDISVILYVYNSLEPEIKDFELWRDSKSPTDS